MKTPLKILLLILGAGLLARFIGSATDTVLFPDSKAFLQSTGALLTQQWQDFRPERTPGYPLFLMLGMGVATLFGLPLSTSVIVGLTVLLQSLLGCLTALLVGETVQRLFKTPWLSLVAGLACALSPNLIYYEHFLLSESLYAFLLAAYAFALTAFWENADPKKLFQCLTLGLIAALLIWTRQIAIVLIATTVVHWWLGKRQKELMLYCLLVFVAVGAWVGFQYKAHGFIGYSAGSGLNQLYKVVDFVPRSTLEADFKRLLWQRAQLHPQQRHYEAVNDVHVIHAMANEESPNPRPYDEIYLEDDRKAATIVKETLQKEPVRYVMVSFAQLGALLLPGTERDPHNLYWAPLLFLWLLGMSLSIVHCIRQRTLNTPQGPLMLMSVITAGHLLLYPWLTVCVPRYRIPLEPLMIILSSYAVLCLWQNRRTEQPSA